MNFFKSILLCALLAGLGAGVLLTGLQTFKVYPLIFAAETFEKADQGTTETSGAAAEAEEWMPADGGERLYYSLQSNVLVGIAMGLVLAAIFAVRGVTDWKRGVMWGLGGFIAVNLAPAFGLPPELPGMPAADLLARQLWWWGTVAATAGGLALIFLGSDTLWRIAGIVLIVAPHIVGAPHPADIATDVPAVLAADFATATLTANLIFWVVLGAIAANVLAYQNKHDANDSTVAAA